MVKEYTDIERYALFFILMRIMEADYIIDEREKILLNRLFVEFEIKEYEISIISNMEQRQCELIIKEIESSKKEFAVSLFNKMAMADNVLDSRELAIIERILR